MMSHFYNNGATVIQNRAPTHKPLQIATMTQNFEDQTAAAERLADALNQHGVMLHEMRELAKALEDVADVPQSFFDAIVEAERIS